MPEKVRAKMCCSQVSTNADGTHLASFYPVTDGSEENKEFFKWTPGGKLELAVLKNQYFVPGREYYVDITPAPVPAQPVE